MFLFDLKSNGTISNSPKDVINIHIKGCIMHDVESVSVSSLLSALGLQTFT